MKKPETMSLGALARSADPFRHEDALLKALRASKSETRHLEWKQTLPFGPAVTKRTKYRIVKAIISFANTDGGFVVCGVNARGQWEGVSADELAHTDPSKITELVSGVVFPEIPQLNYTEISHDGRSFAVIHTPPSDLMPHVTTKAVNDTLPDGTVQPLISDRVVYYRYGGKSDLASPMAFQRIVTRRTDMLRTDMLRRIREVPVPVPVASAKVAGLGKGTSLRVTRLTDDPSAPAVRLTHDASVASGIFLHEELSDGLFNEINNVLAANKLLAKGQSRFFLGEPLYYRIYAERQHVLGETALFGLLLDEGIHTFYAPALFWLHRAPVEVAADTIAKLCIEGKSPHIYFLLRLSFLLGRDFAEWVCARWDKRWHSHPQPPDYFWTMKKMLNRKDVKKPVLVALRSKEDAAFPWPGEGDRLRYGSLAESPQLAAKYLSTACMKVFEGKDEYRSPCRYLDFLAYASVVAERADSLKESTIERIRSAEKE